MFLSSVHLFTCFYISLLFVQAANGHALINNPPSRGTLNPSGRIPFSFHTVDPTAPVDKNAQYPSGVRGAGGAGRLSQLAALGNTSFQLFNPSDPDYIWPTSVCGDAKGGIENRRRGGIYYHNATISATYSERSTIDIGVSMAANHRGFMEFHVCDMSKCDGEISESCFRVPGACHKLIRAENPVCESGSSVRCGPIDRMHPSRWYVSCPLISFDQRETLKAIGWRAFDKYEPGTIRYNLPENMHCEHCVLHWHWVTGNNCNPPGHREYFTRAGLPPNWNSICTFKPKLGLCGVKGRYPEQYFSCSDIRIVKKSATGSSPAPTVTPAPGIQPNINGSLWRFKIGMRHVREQFML